MPGLQGAKTATQSMPCLRFLQRQTSRAGEEEGEEREEVIAEPTRKPAFGRTRKYAEGKHA